MDSTLFVPQRRTALHIRANVFAAPADATTYYWGGTSLAPQATAVLNPIVVPYAGIIVGISVLVVVAGTLGTTETMSAIIRVNNTTDTTVINNTIQHNAVTQGYIATGLSISLAPGDYFEIKWVTPTWATNPTNVFYSGNVFFDITA